MKRELVVGIIGGMGPEATVDLMHRVIALTPASDDIDHIHMIVDNNPKVPSRIKAIIEGTGESPAPVIADMAKRLESAGADFLVMPCNTAHWYYSDAQQAVSIPVVNLPELVAGTLRQQHSDIHQVGMLASTALIKTELYQPVFEKRELTPVFPQEVLQNQLMDLIKKVKAKAYDEHDLAHFSQAAEQLKAQGVGCLVIACTELSVISESLQSSLPVYDASELLAQHIVTRVKG
ncbi:aspartate/glutamate racemase family protein [Vibrio sp. S9_S30]|uniref:aspartate/glutamate racemase family protein n=1 Tax=Vibrio sp. S9_S30 TaxID=2720226 RepID=UPI00167FE939|nr:amino acid racemase [Vibrio sp. S9_S30]MBD1559282.1 aspartate/glutamate racemase family protein [Vibrio sp. S9_S30]